MSSLFPFINPSIIEDVGNIVTEKDMPLPLYREIAWDFDNNAPILENGEFKIVEGDEAIKVWSYFAIKTNRYEHSIYSWDFGCEINSLVGKGYTQDLVKSESERFLKECLLINPYIVDVSIDEISFNDGVLSANIKITTIYNQNEGEVIVLNV